MNRNTEKFSSILFLIFSLCGCSTLFPPGPEAVTVSELPQPLPVNSGEEMRFLNDLLVRHTRFFSVSMKDWNSKVEAFRAVLMKKATEAGLNAESLHKVLLHVDASRQGKRLPVAAYSTTFGGRPVWIVCAMLGGGHWETFAYTTDDMSEVGGTTCR
jgi:hypothetical protein